MTPSSRPRYFVLDAAHNVVPTDDLLAWGRFCAQDDQRRVASTRYGTIDVSTVFLGLNHRFFGGGPPLLFETMIFGGPYDQYQDRYASWDDALLGHRRACRLVESLILSRNLREGRYLARLRQRKDRAHA